MKEKGKCDLKKHMEQKQERNARTKKKGERKKKEGKQARSKAITT